MSKIYIISKKVQRLSHAGLLIGALLMIMHWTGGRELVYCSKMILVFSSLLTLALAPEKTYGHWAGIIGFIAILLYWFNIPAIHFADIYLLSASAVAWIIWYWDVGMEDGFMGKLLPFAPNHSIVSRVIFYSSFIAIVTGALFKIMHWEYANELLIVGMGSAAISILLPFVMKNET